MNGSVIGVSEVTTGRTRAITAENPDGAKAGGARAQLPADASRDTHPARDLGEGWKVRPSVLIPPHDRLVLAHISGSGYLRHLWFTTEPRRLRSLVLRMWWDAAKTPAIAVPLGDFFCLGWSSFAQVSSAPVAVNPFGGLNCYWEMPFRTAVRVEIENVGESPAPLYYEVDYELTSVPAAAAYLHASWRRSNPVLDSSIHTILTLPTGSGGGHYVGTYIAWGVNSCGWWGEGEVKFYLDGDERYPTICGTGTEDYFGGAWNFDVQQDGSPRGYTSFTTLYSGLPQVIRPDGLYASQQRFGMYRWHIIDPIRFTDNLRVTIQALGWRSGDRFLPLHDDIASTALWYQSDPEGQAESSLTADELETL